MRCPVSILWGITQRLGISACRVSSCRPRPISRPQNQTSGPSIRKLPNSVARRRRFAGRLGRTWAIPNFGPPGQLISCARKGARARAFQTNRNRVIRFAGHKEDLGTLIGNNRIPQLGIRRFSGRVSHLSCFFEAHHDFPRQGLLSCRRGRFQGRIFLRPRSSCILAQAGPEAPPVLPRNLGKGPRKSPNSTRSPHK